MSSSDASYRLRSNNSPLADNGSCDIRSLIRVPDDIGRRNRLLNGRGSKKGRERSREKQEEVWKWD